MLQTLQFDNTWSFRAILGIKKDKRTKVKFYFLGTFAYSTKPLRTIFRKDFYFHTSDVLYNYTYSMIHCQGPIDDSFSF